MEKLTKSGFKWLSKRGERAKVSHKRVFALLTPKIRSSKMAHMLQKPVFALPGCQRMSVNTLLCDTLGLAEKGLLKLEAIFSYKSPKPDRRRAAYETPILTSA